MSQALRWMALAASSFRIPETIAFRFSEMKPQRPARPGAGGVGTSHISVVSSAGWRKRPISRATSLSRPPPSTARPPLRPCRPTAWRRMGRSPAVSAKAIATVLLRSLIEAALDPPADQMPGPGRPRGRYDRPVYAIGASSIASPRCPGSCPRGSSLRTACPRAGSTAPPSASPPLIHGGSRPRSTTSPVRPPTFHSTSLIGPQRCEAAGAPERATPRRRRTF